MQLQERWPQLVFCPALEFMCLVPMLEEACVRCQTEHVDVLPGSFENMRLSSWSAWTVRILA